MLASKSTESSLYMLSQSIVALRSYSKVAYLKWSKSRIVHLPLSSFFFSSHPSAVTPEVAWLKQPLIARKFPKDGSFMLSLKQNYSLR